MSNYLLLRQTSGVFSGFRASAQDRHAMENRRLCSCEINVRLYRDILVLVRMPVASFTCIIFWTSGWTLTKLAKIHFLESGKSLLDFGDLDLIFKGTQALWNVKFWPESRVSAHYLFARLYILFHRDTIKSWLDFGEHDVIFKVTIL